MTAPMCSVCTEDQEIRVLARSAGGRRRLMCCRCGHAWEGAGRVGAARNAAVRLAGAGLMGATAMGAFVLLAAGARLGIDA